MPPSPSANLVLRILVVDDEDVIRTQLSHCLEADGHQVVAHSNVHDALAAASWKAFDLIFLQLHSGTDSGIDFVAQFLQESPWARVIIATSHALVDSAVEAIQRGAADYLLKPFTPAQVRLATQKVAHRRQLERKVEAMQLALDGLDPEADFPTASAAMERAIQLARQVADSNATLLIRGEVGTGKGRMARAIHAWSRRAEGPFSAIPCHAASPDALDTELFGMTARDSQARSGDASGRVDFCDGGTLVLEEVGDTPPGFQPKLIRLLRDREYERHNDFKARPSNARIIATTSVDLESMAQRGRFREDLLRALEVVRIDIPPLRQRPEDIRLLAARYLAFFARDNHRRIGGFTRHAADALNRHSWPGNVRELRNVIERAVLLCKEEEIGIEHLPHNLLNSPAPYAVGDLVPLDIIEQLHIRKVVASTRSIASAASILGIHPGTIMRRMKRTGPEGQGADDSPGLSELAAGDGDAGPSK